jgi:hypothetical protein
MSAAPNNRQPWPMKWIVLAIVLVAVPYTFLTLRFRKPGPAFQPYEDMKNRANVARLLAAGYQRLPLHAQRPADGARTAGGAAVTTVPGGLPDELRTTLVEPLLLPTEITGVIATPATTTLLPYSVHFTCTLPDDRQQLGGADLYLRVDKLVLAPTFERISGDLLARSQQAAVLLTIPGGTLQPGRYTVTLLGEKSSRSWPLEVK